MADPAAPAAPADEGKNILHFSADIDLDAISEADLEEIKNTLVQKLMSAASRSREETITKHSMHSNTVIVKRPIKM